MAIDFRIGKHSIRPGIRIVEILVDGKVAGVIYPAGEKRMRLVSAHITDSALEPDFAGEVVKDDGSLSYPPIPALVVTFSPSAYFIRGNRIVKIPQA